MKRFLIILMATAAFVACEKAGEPAKYSITVTGGVSIPADKAVEGAEVRLINDDPEEGMEFISWESGDVEIIDNRFTMPAHDVAVAAIFEPKGPVEPILYTVTVDGGTADAEEVAEGDEVTLVPEIPEESVFIRWAVITGNVEIVDNKFTMPAEDVELEAVFGYTVTVDGGTADPEEAAEGDEVTLTPTVPQGYELFIWESEDIDIVGNKFKMPDHAVEVKAVFRLVVAASYILYWDAENGVPAAGHWGEEVSQSNILFTRFGSLVAYTMTSNEDGWDAGDVKFTPADTDYGDYNTIPYWVGTETTDGYISSDGYHNDANLSEGRGDICKLVGLTPAEAAAKASSGTLDDYDSGLRLPTCAENIDFMAVPLKAYYLLYSDSSLAFWSTAAVGGGNGAYFPVPGNRQDETGRTVRNTDPTGFLPAAGLRNGSGSPMEVGMGGYYRSSMTNAVVEGGYILTFSDIGLRPMVGGPGTFGYAVRCVPDP